MTTSDNGFKPTPGPWLVDSETLVAGDFDHFAGGLLIADCGRPRKSDRENAANAALIAQAGTVYGETGKTPRQLADDVARLRTALATVEHWWSNSGAEFGGVSSAFWQGAYEPIRVARAALAATEARHA